MRPRERVEVPSHIEAAFRRAVRLEWISFFLMLSGAVLVYFTLGQSQAMKAVWAEDVLALIPPLSFLISMRYRFRAPNKRFPYGYHHSVTVGFLASAVVLLSLGVLLLFDSLRTLATREHPTIGAVDLFGRTIWLGWITIPVLLYTIGCEYTMGRIKLPVAQELYDTTLSADARMNRADWLTGATGLVGVTLIALGFWWADSLAASIISVEIIRDGWSNLKAAVYDVLDEIPSEKADEAHRSEAANKLVERVTQLPWVLNADVRLREEGNFLTGEVFVELRAMPEDVEQKRREINAAAREVDWRFYDLSLAFVDRV